MNRIIVVALLAVAALVGAWGLGPMGCPTIPRAAILGPWIAGGGGGPGSGTWVEVQIVGGGGGGLRDAERAGNVPGNAGNVR